jgi:hypothetical protein
MQRTVQIASRDFQLTAAMEAQIRERADLQLYFPRLTGCHVVVEAPFVAPLRVCCSTASV